MSGRNPPLYTYLIYFFCKYCTFCRLNDIGEIESFGGRRRGGLILMWIQITCKMPGDEAIEHAKRGYFRILSLITLNYITFISTLPRSHVVRPPETRRFSCVQIFLKRTCTTTLYTTCSGTHNLSQLLLQYHISQPSIVIVNNILYLVPPMYLIS